jgi:hypothetical protein
MKHFLVSSALLLLVACTKEEVRIVPVEAPQSKQSTTTTPVETEGTVNGGGGKAVLCNGPSGATVTTLDLYEARVVYGLDPLANPANETEAIELVSDLLAKHFWRPDIQSYPEFKQTFGQMLKRDYLNKIKFIGAGKKLKRINDSLEALIENDCEMVQVAAYYDESVILVDQSLWQQMNWLNRSALLAHEIVYAMDRKNGAKNSVVSRKLVGHLFSAQGIRSLTDGLPLSGSKYLACKAYNSTGRSYDIYMYEANKNGKAGMELILMGDGYSRYLLRTSAFVENLEYKKALDFSTGLTTTNYTYLREVRATADVETDTYPTNLTFSIVMGSSETAPPRGDEPQRGAYTTYLSFSDNRESPHLICKEVK